MKKLLFALIIAMPLTAFSQMTYKGESKSGVPNGQGVMSINGVVTYTGSWKNGKPDGQGTYNFPNGDAYTGEWKEAFKDGNGTYSFPDGKKYIGEWKRDKTEGQGTLIFANGEIYEGNFSANLFNGTGKLTTKNGYIFLGTFYQHRLIEGKVLYPNGSYYVGTFDGFEKRTGVLYDSNGKLLNQYQNGKIKDASDEAFENEKRAIIAAGVLLLFSAFLSSGDNPPAKTYNDPYENRGVPWGYDRTGSPIYDRTTPLYYDKDGKKLNQW